MYTFLMTIDWKHTRETYALMQEMQRELPPQKRAEEALIALFAFPRFALGTALCCGSAAIADIACAVTKRVSGKQ